LTTHVYRAKDTLNEIYVRDFDNVYISGFCPGSLVSREEIQLHFAKSDSYTTATTGKFDFRFAPPSTSKKSTPKPNKSGAPFGL
jgi:hypothetical protein